MTVACSGCLEKELILDIDSILDEVSSESRLALEREPVRGAAAAYGGGYGGYGYGAYQAEYKSREAQAPPAEKGRRRKFAKATRALKA